MKMKKRIALQMRYALPKIDGTTANYTMYFITFLK